MQPIIKGLLFLTLNIMVLLFSSSIRCEPSYQTMIWAQTENDTNFYKPQLVYRTKPENIARHNFCIILPDSIDYYWEAINYGLFTAAKEYKQSLHIYTLKDSSLIHSIDPTTCSNQQADVIIVYHPDSRVIDALADIYHPADVPIICINVSSKHCQLQLGAPIKYQRLFLSNWLYKEYQNRNTPLKIAIFPGEDDSSTHAQLTAELNTDPEDPLLNIVTVQYSESSLFKQSRAVEDVKKHFPDLDILIGTESAIRIATKIFQSTTEPMPDFISLNFSPKILRELKRNTIKLAMSENTVLLAKQAIYVAIEYLQGHQIPYQTSPPLEMISPSLITTYEYRKAIAPQQFRPMLDLN